MEFTEHQEKPEPIRKRHGFVTFWLIYILLNGISNILAFTIFRSEMEEVYKKIFNDQVQFVVSDEIAYYLIGLGVLNTISSILLLKWKKIGFHGLIISNIVNMYVSGLMGSGIEATFLGVMQIGILYMVLQIKKNEKSTWDWLT